MLICKAGRLLIRKAISESLQIPFSKILLARSDKGRPYMACPSDDSTCPVFDFNISHQGDYVVLAAESLNHVGIDLMRIDRPVGSKSVEQFFLTMSRQFTQDEWNMIKSASDEAGKLFNFYRLWCLKESFVKLVGFGIGYSLRRLNFTVHSALSVGRTVNDTDVQVDGRLQIDWKFEETMLDDNHIVCVALRQLPKVVSDVSSSGIVPFIHLNPDNLFEGVAELSAIQPSDWDEFIKKPIGPNVLELQ